jgi:hypothetical protein
LRQGAFDGSFVEPQGNKVAFLVQRIAKTVRVAFQLRPVRAERLRRHTEYKHTGMLQPFLDLRRNAVAGTDFPVIKPNAYTVRPQPLCDGTNDRLVFRAVTQEYVVCEIVSHASPLALCSSSYQGDERYNCQPNFLLCDALPTKYTSVVITLHVHI